jgi:hypothetical protein
MARVPTEPARAAPAVTGTEVLVGAVPLPLGAAVPVLGLVVMVEEALVVEAAELEALVVEELAAELEALVVAAEELEALVVEEEPPAATAWQNLVAAGRTVLTATSEPQAAIMAAAAAPWMAAWLAVVHWQV